VTRPFSYRFGPRIEAGGVTFRLWAPAVPEVAVVVDPDGPAEARHPLADTGDGWREGHVPGAGPGTRYLFDIGTMRVPDPASRRQPDDALGPSEVVDPTAYRWRATDWRGRPWAETVLYELHVGTFAESGDYTGVEARLDHLAGLGVTAVELLPVSDFPGARNWGYDGVLPFAPDGAYGRPDDLKRLVDAIHGRGMMAFLDVVYNHFGPEGNFLHAYAPQFFDETIHTPWGAAIDFARPQVRRFFVENVLYWLGEFRFDGLRFDAVHAIEDRQEPHVLTEIAGLARAELGPGRHVHLVLENDANEAARLRRNAAGHAVGYDAQWNDDFHHVCHHLLTGETDGYYTDFADQPVARLGRALRDGFVYQGEPSPFRDGERRGEPSGDLPPTCFVDFLQNHDQVGNRAMGDRLDALAEPRALHAMRVLHLLSPSIPLMFMGEEWGSTRPFLFFCDFHDDLADAVREGRRREFEKFPAFADAAAREAIPDPNAGSTVAASRLDWAEAARAPHAGILAETRRLLALRQAEIVPLLDRLHAAEFVTVGARGLRVHWSRDGAPVLALLANLGPETLTVEDGIEARLIEASAPIDPPVDGRLTLPGWTVAWWRYDAGAAAP
jgi:malto-oligosyltrehalose trehalohydrolase